MFNRTVYPRLVAGIAVMLSFGAAWSQEAPPTVIPPPKIDDPSTSSASQTAVLAGGCYWGAQGIFQHVRGVKRVIAGFSGGWSDSDGAAEAVKITFNPRVISYGKLLQIYFSVVHDPTELNRQGPDVGISYRSDIFYVNETQEKIAKAYISQLDQAGVFPAKIVTRVDKFSMFHPAVSSQQNFMIKHPGMPYIKVNDLPKLPSLKRMFPSHYQSSVAPY
jgi:peptide-methionine (S)-S-oxide reductase